MNRLDLNDPKLTAFALGELEGQEAIEMAKQVENDPAAQAYVNEIRETETVVKLELAKEDATARLPLEARDQIMAGGKVSWWKKPLFVIPTVTFTTAAALILVFINRPGLVPLQGEMGPLQTEMAKQSTSVPAVTAPAQPAKQDTIVAVQELQVAADESMQAEQMEDSSAPADVAATLAAPSAPSASSAGQIAGLAPNAKSGALKKGVGLTARGGSPGMFSAFGRAESGVSSMRMNAMPMMAPPPADMNTERYSHISENGYKSVKDEALSTFSIDVDTASYANVRRMLNAGALPPVDAVRIEEMLNYFKYTYPQPTDGRPFSVNTEITQAPWNTKHKLVRIGLKGKEIPDTKRPSTNLVFLIDVSGSMMDPNKLPLVQASMKLLVEKMRPDDRVSIVTYANGDQIVLDSTSGKEKTKILEAVDRLTAGGGTNGAAGINSAYKIAQAHFIKGGVNRVILSTDGDFNVGTTSESELLKLAEEKAKSGVFLTVLGFGAGNYNDSMMVKLADKGNGNHAYIDSLREAQKVLVEQAGGTLQTIAKDVKIQVEFNPKHVSSYRLIGYEKRMLAKEDFNDDTKDAGEIGAGHTVTALYEIVPAGINDVKTAPVDALKYQASSNADDAKTNASDELLTVKLRYKKPDGKTSEKFDVPVKNEEKTFEQASSDMKFATSVAGFGMLLRNSEFKGDMTWDKVVDIALANAKTGGQVDDNRLEFLGLTRKAKDLMNKVPKKPSSSFGGSKNQPDLED